MKAPCFLWIFVPFSALISESLQYVRTQTLFQESFDEKKDPNIENYMAFRDESSGNCNVYHLIELTKNGNHIENNVITDDEVGKPLKRFCKGLRIVFKNSASSEKLNRVKRQLSTKRYRGQTQTQYIAFNGGDKGGTAEAVATPEVSRAIVSGSQYPGRPTSEYPAGHPGPFINGARPRYPSQYPGESKPGETRGPGTTQGKYPGTIPGQYPGAIPGEQGTRPGQYPGTIPLGAVGTRPGQHPGQHPGVIPGGQGARPGHYPGTIPGPYPGYIPGEQGAKPGQYPGTIPGQYPGAIPGEQGAKPGQYPGTIPGQYPGAIPGEQGAKPGQYPATIPVGAVGTIPGQHPGVAKPEDHQPSVIPGGVRFPGQYPGGARPGGISPGEYPGRPGAMPGQYTGTHPIGTIPGQYPGVRGPDGAPQGHYPGYPIGSGQYPTGTIPGETSPGKSPVQYPSLQPGTSDPLPGQYPGSYPTGVRPVGYPSPPVHYPAGTPPGRHHIESGGARPGIPPAQYPGVQSGGSPQGTIPGQYPSYPIGARPGQYPGVPGGQGPDRTSPAHYPGSIVPGAQYPIGPGQDTGTVHTGGTIPGGILTSQYPSLRPGESSPGAIPGQYPGSHHIGTRPEQYPGGHVPEGISPSHYPGGVLPSESPSQYPGVQPGVAIPGRYPGGTIPAQFPSLQPGVRPGGVYPSGQPGESGAIPGQYTGAQPIGTRPGEYTGGQGPDVASPAHYPGGVQPGVYPAGPSQYPGAAIPGTIPGIHPGVTQPGQYQPGGSPDGLILTPGYPGVITNGQYPSVSRPGQYPDGSTTCVSGKCVDGRPEEIPIGSRPVYYPDGAKPEYYPGGVKPGEIYPGGSEVGRSVEFDTQAQTSINYEGNETKAISSSQGRYGSGAAQTQVSGTYSGTGAFSAQAQTSDDHKGAQSKIEGNSKGATSTAQGRAGSSQAQTQIQVGKETGSTLAESQTSGINFATNTQVQAGNSGGIADSQSKGPGATSSQAQIGFFPYDGTTNEQKSTYKGGGSASAQSSHYSGQSQSQIQGAFKYGISYTGAAQSSSGVSDLKFPKLSLPGSLYNTSTARKEVANPKIPQIIDKKTTTQKPTVKPADTVAAAAKLPSKHPHNEDDEEYDDEDYEEDDEIGLSQKSNIISTTQKPLQQNQPILLNPVKPDLLFQNSAPLTPLKPGDILQPGQEIPGSDYKIPNGFRGRVTSVSDDKTQAFTSNDQNKPGPKMYPFIASNNGLVRINKPYQPYDSFVTLTNSETGQLKTENPDTSKKYAHTYYTKSSTCGYFAFTCTAVSGSNGRTKVCKPRPQTNPDGTPCGA